MKAAHGLIPTGSHQVVVNEFIRSLQWFLEDKQDGLGGDLHWNAMQDKRVFGVQRTMQTRQESNKRLTIDAFHMFQQKRKTELETKITQIQAEQQSIEQIQAIMKRDKSSLSNALERQNDLLSLQEELDALQKSTSFADFAKKTGQFQSYDQEFEFLKDVFEKQKDDLTDNNKQAIQNAMDSFHPFIESRYNMIQSISFALKEDLQLPQLAYNEQDIISYYNDIATGLKRMQETQRDDWYWLDEGRGQHIHDCAWNIYRPLSKIEGLSNAYEDAISTIMNSEEWEKIRHYIRIKATQNNNVEKIIALDGTRNSLNYYIDQYPPFKKANIPNLLDSWDKDPTKQTVFMNTSRVYTEINPVLNTYTERVQLYHFLQQTIQEYQNDKKQNPQEVARISAIKDVYPVQSRKLLELSTEKFRRDNRITTERIYSCATRLMDKDKIGQTIWRTGTTAIMFIPVGNLVATAAIAGFTIGAEVALSAANMEVKDENGNISYDNFNWGESEDQKPRVTCLHIVEDKLAEIPWMDKLADIADTHIRDDMKIYYENSCQREKIAVEAINQIPMDDFDKALSFAMNSTNTSVDDNILSFVYDVRKLQTEYPTKKELLQAYAEHKKECEKNDVNFGLEPNNLIYSQEHEELKYNELLFQAAITGRYFAMASIYHYEQGEPAVRNYDKFSGKNKQILEQLDQAIAAATSAEYELQLRSEIMMNWKQNDCIVVDNPKAEEDKKFEDEMKDIMQQLFIQYESNIPQQQTETFETSTVSKNLKNAGQQIVSQQIEDLSDATANSQIRQISKSIYS